MTRGAAYAPAIAKKTDSDCGRKRKDSDLVYKQRRPGY
jgi:hypothetical protein